MRNRCVALVLCLAAAFAHVPVAAAQDARGANGWAALQALPTGAKLKVRMKSGETVEGRLSMVSDAGLTLLRKGAAVELRRDGVRKVYRVGGPSVKKSTLVGLGIGTGVGAAVGTGFAVSGEHESGEAHMPVFVFGAGGAIIGTLTGLTAGLLGRRRVLIYESD
ncbi:MAG TPA: hypothetical protein VK421_06685 [Pyrinomonadaceae bacterium]|nr:hypothetical protein [Pyrinomonadaceae bacterium]